MSLATDTIFVDALQSNSELMELLTPSEQGGETVIDEVPRLYGTSIGLPDEDAENVPVPYVIVTFDGLNNDQGTKDELYESCYDTVNIGIEVAAKTLDDLHDLTQMVRETVLSYLRTTETNINDYQFGAQRINYDPDKPCYWQVLTYQCNVYNIIEHEQENGNNEAGGQG